VKNGATLTVEPGVVAKNPNITLGECYSASPAGRIIAEGTPEEPIVFTSAADSPQPGDWGGIVMFEQASPAGQSVFRHCVFEYGGKAWYCTYDYGPWYEAMLVVAGSGNAPTVDHCTFRYSSKNGVYIGGSNSASITNSTITANRTGLNSASSGQVVVTGSEITGNTDFGVYASAGRVSAENNWWGDGSGPYDPSDDRAAGGLYNPTGKGDKVSDRVDYDPWVGKAGFPSVYIVRPSNGATVRGIVPIEADATDPQGIANVQFKIDDVAIYTDATPPYYCEWDTTPAWVTEGTHTIRAVATAADGHTGSASVTIAIDNSTFDDVPKTYQFWRYIEALVSAGVTSGCLPSPPLYCPNLTVTREQMAKFLCVAAGKGWLDATTPSFADVPRGHTFYGWIERLADPGSWGGNPPTSGCTATTYCADQSVTRAQVAKFLCKARGKSWLAKAAPTFSDVPANHLFYGWIERLADAGSWGGTPPTSGCGAGRYCPNSTVTRGQMAKFLVLAFGLPY
jgi:hypothetical protein